MFYRVAVIQNEKEVFRYDCADLAKMTKTLPDFRFYKFIYYDENNIFELFSYLNKFDSVFFATNSLISEPIYRCCCDHKRELETYIKGGHGLFVGYSSKTRERLFLPDDLIIVEENRSLTTGDTAMDGDLIFANHPIISSHKVITPVAYTKKAKNHTTISGLYFSYLRIIHPEKNYFDCLVGDKNTGRALLLCTKSSTGTKVVLSTLPIDWQQQFELFINTVKYCTEGEASIVIFAKTLNEKIDFSREYLYRQLSQYKRAFIYEYYDDIHDINILKHNCNTIIFDASWKDNEVDLFCDLQKQEIFDKKIRVLHYFRYNNLPGSVYKLTVHSAFQQIDLLEDSLLIEIESRTPTKSTHYSYDSSLLTTFDVLKLLKKHNITNKNLNNKIIDNGKKHLLSDGSYDAMFVASCNFLAIWNICDKNANNDIQFIALKNYILKELFEKKKSNISPSEKAQALYFLEEFNIFEDKQISILIKEIFEFLSSVAGDDIYSYSISNCWQVVSSHVPLVITNRVFDIKLIEQNSRYLLRVLGKIDSNCKVIFLSNYIITLCNLLSYKVINDTNEIGILTKTLFSAVNLLHDKRNGNLWNQDLYSSCYAIKALRHFSDLLSSYPVDEILMLSMPNYNISNNVANCGQIVDSSQILEASKKQVELLMEERANTESANTRVSELESSLSNINVTLNMEKEEKEKLQNELIRMKKKVRRKTIFDIVGRISILCSLYLIVQMIYVAIYARDSFNTYLHSFNSFISWLIVGIGSIVPIFELVMYFIKRDDDN